MNKKLNRPRSGLHTKKSTPLLTSFEACAFLGVKPQTLYAYVSRGQLRAEARPGQSGHLYPRDELEALLARSRARAGHAAVAAGAMRWGEPILDSAITCVDGTEILYRGYLLSDLLSRHVRFENVAELLWSGDLPRSDVSWPRNTPLASNSWVDAESSDAGSSVARRLIARMSQVALEDHEGPDELLDMSLRRARAVQWAATGELFGDPARDRLCPAGEAGVGHLGGSMSLTTAIAQRLELEDCAAAHRAINASLVVSADHELNASTFAARVAASTGADLYACHLAGLAAFSGRHHGLAPIDSYNFVRAAPSHGDLGKYLNESLRNGRSTPGFGHRLYHAGDPRAQPLLNAAQELADTVGGERRRLVDRTFALIDLAASRGLPPPNLDLGLVAVAFALGLLATGASRLFVVGRLAGWTAHILEQRQQGFLLRPRARYTGSIARHK